MTSYIELPKLPTKKIRIKFKLIFKEVKKLEAMARREGFKSRESYIAHIVREHIKNYKDEPVKSDAR